MGETGFLIVPSCLTSVSLKFSVFRLVQGRSGYSMNMCCNRDRPVLPDIGEKLGDVRRGAPSSPCHGGVPARTSLCPGQKAQHLWDLLRGVEGKEKILVIIKDNSPELFSDRLLEMLFV